MSDPDERIDPDELERLDDEDYPFMALNVDKLHETMRNAGRAFTDLHDEVADDLALLRSHYYENDCATDIQTCLQIMEYCNQSLPRLLNYDGE